MHKLIIFSALIVCALASWAPSDGQHRQHPQGSNQSVVSHDAKVGHARHSGRTGVERDVRATHGQMESVRHGGGTVYPNKEFRRTKKGQPKKRSEVNRGRNHLRRVRSDKHSRH